MILAFLGAALAGDVFASVGAEVGFGTGTWSRIHVDDTGWWYFKALGGDFWRERLDDDLSGYDDSSRVNVTNFGVLQDIQVERCADTSWLVAGSYSLDAPDDSARAWHFDADFNLIAEVNVEERASARSHNDMVVFCSLTTIGTAFSIAPGTSAHGSVFLDLEYNVVGSMVDLDWASMGASMALRTSDERIVAVDVDGPDDENIRFTVFDPDWSTVEKVDVPVPDGVAFWPQRLLHFGDGWILTYLARPADIHEGDGEVWLMAMDADFNLVDSVQVTAEGTLNGRPWVVWKGDKLAVSYDREVSTYVTLVQINPDALPSPEDTGAVDTGIADSGGDSGGDTAVDTGVDSAGDSGIGVDTSDSGGSPEVIAKDGEGRDCGCGMGGAGAAAVCSAGALGILAGRRRGGHARRTPQAPQRTHLQSP
ncbi:hypothetical protein LBMAG42_51840 [Deltaproteobacteria bacterium]|nr:hypothetical protein LBMAG42_51840 [Deltaproteobacteria bacterium]